MLSLGAGFIRPDGADVAATGGERGSLGTSAQLVLTQASESFLLCGPDAEPVPSLLRGFSAPVVLHMDHSDAQLLHLLMHDPTPLTAGGQPAPGACAVTLLDADQLCPAQPLDEACIQAMRSVLRHPHLDAAFKELALTLPSETHIAEQVQVVDPSASICCARSDATAIGANVSMKTGLGLRCPSCARHL